MSTPTPTPTPTSTSPPASTAAAAPASLAGPKIRELCEIDQDIASLLAVAASSLTTLGTSPSPGEAAFATDVAEYHRLLSSIAVRLQRQVWALQGAEIPVGGEVDAGVLNARNDLVGREMEASLWREGRELVEGKMAGEGGK
ncbi:hypothetical protein EDC01DRAFT_786917 [Geopyxis carbonaria]|nr:hypothetical protein EDC01DRAFT_786917 [Geopyxis carbonaria]